MDKKFALAIAAALALTLAACSEDTPVPTESETAVSPGAGMPADGGLTVGEAKASELEGPLMVGGFLVAEGDTVRLCDALAESFPPQCGGDSLVVEGLDLDAYDTQSEGDVRWTDEPVAVLGDVDGDTLRVSETAM